MLSCSLEVGGNRWNGLTQALEFPRLQHDDKCPGVSMTNSLEFSPPTVFSVLNRKILR